MRAAGGARVLLPWSLAALIGGIAGYVGWDVAFAARAYCDTAFEAGDRFGLVFVLLPAVVVGGCGYGAAAWGAGRALARRAPTAWGLLLPWVLVLVVAVTLPWAVFATVGTPDGTPGPPWVCPPSNIPPWWPAWIPA